MKYVVKLDNGVLYYLRGTTWTSERERANEFQSLSNAGLALEKARKFMLPKLRKRAVITQVAIA